MVAKTIVAMLVVGLLPLSLFAGVMLKQEGDAIRSGAELSVQRSAERITAQVDDWFDKNVRVLQAAATLPAVVSMQPEEQVEVLTAIQKAYPWMYLVFTMGPAGQNVARSDGKPLTDYSDRQYFKDAANGKELSWETVIGKTSKKAALIVALPIKAGGRIVGVLAAAMTVEDISRIAANWRTGRTGFAFVVDEKAKAVAHPREEFVGTPTYLNAHPLISAFQSSGRAQLVSFTETDGNDVTGYVQGNKLGWAVAVQQNDEEVFEPLRRTLTLGLTFLAIAAALVAVISWFFSRMLIRPIVEMTRAADRMSLGELTEPIRSSRGDEIGLLAQSLERLRKSMKAAFDRLMR